MNTRSGKFTFTNVFRIAQVLFLVLAQVGAVVTGAGSVKAAPDAEAPNRDTRTWTDPGGSGLQITFSTPETYFSCNPGSDRIYTQGVPNDWSLRGFVNIYWALPGGGWELVPNGSYAVDQTGNLDLTIFYPPAWAWPDVDPSPGWDLRELHIDLGFVVRNAEGQVVTWVGGDPSVPGTLGPGGQDWNVYCNGNPPSRPNITIVKYTNGLDANDPDASGVPQIAPGQPVVWTYDVKNIGTVAIAKIYINVTDNVPGVNPMFDSVKSGDSDDLLEPGEVWTYKATGTALNLATSSLPTLVPNVCRQGNVNAPGSTAYTNIGTVSVPGAQASDPSSYCNPPAQRYTLGDRVWYDQNQNGIQDANEPGYPGGVSVALYQGGACTGPAMATTTTNGSGLYQFTNLLAGTYSVGFSGLPAGWNISPKDQGSNNAVDSDANAAGCIENINLTADDPTQDMGIYVPGTLGDNVMCVTTGQPLANITVNLYKDFNGDGVADGPAIATTQTNASGFYQFTGLEVALAGDPNNITKYVVVVDAADPDLGGCNVPIPPTSYNPPLDSNNPNDPNNDFKFQFPQRFTLGDRVWYDQNQNGIQDANEPGYPGGVSVALYQGGACTGPAMATTTTNGSGLYQFTNLLAGTYSVGFSGLPAGWSISPKDQGSNNAVDSDANAAGCIENINLTADDPTQDMGIYVPGTLGDNVMCVTTGQPLANITVNLYKDFNGDGVADGPVIATTQTNASGFYQFTGLEVALAGDPNNITKYVVVVDAADPDLGDCNVPIPPTSYNPPLDSNNPNDPNNDFKFEKSLLPAVDLEKFVLVIPTTGAGDMCATYGKPQILTMKYIGGAASVNAQDPSKVIITGNPGTTSPVRIVATNSNASRTYFDGQVSLGGTFNIDAKAAGQTTLETNTYFKVYSLGGSLLQSVAFHTSCSQPIQLGDIYGSAQLVGFSNSSGAGGTLPEAPTGMGDDADTPPGPTANLGDTIQWTYVVTNTGNTPLENAVVSDDVLGFVCNIPYLAQGDSESCVATGLADQFGQYVNEGDVVAHSPQGVEVFDTDPAHYFVPEPCAVCKGGTVELTFQYLGFNSARVTVYDDTSPKADKILFDSTLNPGDQFTITPRPGQAKLNNDITIYVNGVFNAKVHTSCSQPIGPGLISGDFEIVNARSKDSGLMCPLNVCAPNAAATIEIKDREVKWNIANNGDLGLEIRSISITWPQANGALDEIKRDADTIHKGDFQPPFALINSGWDGNAAKRTIKPGETDTLKFKFKNNASTGGEYVIRIEFVQGCFVEVNYSGGTSVSAFTCSKPINELTMIWNGSAPTVWVTAWKGAVGSTALATLQPVSRGAALTVSGFAGSPNDVYWEIFSDPAGTNKLGVSTFHLSCSDADMNGADDCGKPQGDGKGKIGFLNDWLLKGLVDSDETLVCTVP